MDSIIRGELKSNFSTPFSTLKCIETSKYIIVQQLKLGTSFITHHSSKIGDKRQYIYNKITNELNIHDTIDENSKKLINTFNSILEYKSDKKLVFLYRHPEKRLISCVKEDLYIRFYNDIDITDHMDLLLNNKSILLEEYQSFLLEYFGKISNKDLTSMDVNSTFMKISKLLIDLNLAQFWNKEYNFLKNNHYTDYLADILRILHNNSSNDKILLIDIDRYNFSEVLNLSEEYPTILESKDKKENETDDWLKYHIIESFRKYLKKDSNSRYYDSYMRVDSVLYDILVNSSFNHK